jgi:hypothetical protein
MSRLSEIFRFPPILFDTLLLSLTVYKVLRTAPRDWRRIPLLWTVLRDGTWAFLVVLSEHRHAFTE